MKTATLTGAVVKMRNSIQPHYQDNTDILLFDYDFYSTLESMAKKEREKARNKLLDMTTKKEDGTLLRTSKQLFVRKTSNAPQSFDKELFIAKVSEKFKIDRHKLKEVATTSVASGTPRTSYTVEQIDD